VIGDNLETVITLKKKDRLKLIYYYKKNYEFGNSSF